MILAIASLLGVQEKTAKLLTFGLAALAVAVLVWRIVAWDNHRIHAAEQRGSDAAYAAVDKRALDIAAQLTASANQLKEQANEKHTAVAIAATDLRVRGPGRASCPAPVLASTSEPQPTTAQSDVAGPGVSPENWARVPWDWLVKRAQEHDDLLIEDQTWRDNFVAQSKIISEENK